MKCRERPDGSYVVGSLFTDSSKAFDCNPEILLAKFDAYGFYRMHMVLRCIYSYLEKRRQYDINSTTSSFKRILLGGPHWSILEPTLFNLFFNEFFFCIFYFAYNFADDNSYKFFCGNCYSLNVT